MIVLTPWLDHLVAHLPVAREGRDAEGAHQIRVAGRRLIVWLELSGYGVLRDDLRALVRGAGRVRDLEVLLQETLPRSFEHWLRERLAEARAAFVPMLDAPRLNGLLTALAVLPSLEDDAARRRLAHYGRVVKKRAAVWTRSGSLDALHALRRALRRLRYAREWQGLDAADLKTWQETLGRVGDLRFTLDYVSAYTAAGGRALPRYRRECEHALEQAIIQAKVAWNYREL